MDMEEENESWMIHVVRGQPQEMSKWIRVGVLWVEKDLWMRELCDDGTEWNGDLQERFPS